MGKRPTKLAFACLLLLLSIAVLGISGEARELLKSDDFTGRDGTDPDPVMWTERETDTDDYCQILSNTLKTHSQNSGYAYVLGNEHHEENNLTLLVEWKMTIYQGRPIDIRILSNDSVRNLRWISVMFDAGAGWGTINYRYQGVEQQWRYDQDYVRDRWYIVNITVWTDVFNVTIKERDTGNTFLSLTDRACDPLGSDNYAWLGVYQFHSRRAAEAYYDNYRLYDITLPENEPPEWGDLPVLEAVEDVPFRYDFSNNVSDPDDLLANLSLSSVSPFVVSIQRLNVTFLFPNGVTYASVPILLTDGKHVTNGRVTFRIAPVNDPPEHIIPEEMSAVEDVPYTVDLTTFLWDIDNRTSDLSIGVDDRYASSEGRNLTVVFPEGVLDYYLTVYVSDGLAENGTVIHFTITPVDDPPEVAALGTFTVIEDIDSVLDLAPYISDVDTPIEDIGIIVRDPNCTVDGRTLTFHCTLGGLSYRATVEVSDGRNWVRANLTVVVREVNDAPIIGLIPPQTFTEDEERGVDLTSLISDEDTSRSELVLECDHEAVVAIAAFRMSMNYTTWVAPHQVEVAIFDGYARTYANFSVQVQSVNDPPVILGFGGHGEPYVLTIDEGTEAWFLIIVSDEDDTEFTYDVDTGSYCFEALANGTLRVHADKGDVGQYEARVIVTDASNGHGDARVTLRVVNVNDPPDVPTIERPLNHSIHRAGDNITFECSFFDADIQLGQVLVVRWRSNISGEFMLQSSDNSAPFTVGTLLPGVHRIELIVSDGEFEQTAWIAITVEEPPKVPPPDDPAFRVTGTLGLILMVFALIATIAVLAVHISRRPEDGGPEATTDEATEPVVAEVEETPEAESEAETAGWVAEEAEDR